MNTEIGGTLRIQEQCVCVDRMASTHNSIIHPELDNGPLDSRKRIMTKYHEKLFDWWKHDEDDSLALVRKMQLHFEV